MSLIRENVEPLHPRCQARLNSCTDALNGVLLRHAVLKQVQDVLSIGLGFTVSQIIANEAHVVLQANDSSWWPPFAIAITLFVTLLVLLTTTIRLAHVDRDRERKREALRVCEVRAVGWCLWCMGRVLRPCALGWRRSD
jgi:hypothetical protein